MSLLAPSLHVAPNMPFRADRGDLMVIVTYVAFSGWLYSGFLGHLGQQIPGGADGVLYAWFFENAEQSVVHLRDPLVTGLLNAPGGVNVMWNTALLLPALVLSPLTSAIGAPATVTILMAAAPAFSATLTYRALLQLTARRWSSAVTAPLYGFGPFFVGHSGHLNLSLALLPPLVLMFGVRICTQPVWNARARGVRLGIALAAAVLTGEEVVALTAVSAVVVFAIASAADPGKVRTLLPRLAPSLGWALLVAGAVTTVPLTVQLLGPGAISSPFRPDGSADALSFVVPSRLQHFATPASVSASTSFTAVPIENTTYLGLPLVVLLTCLWVRSARDRDTVGAVLLLSVGACALLSLGHTIRIAGSDLGPGPWALLDHLPLAGGVVAVRFSLITALLVPAAMSWHLRTTSGRSVTAIATVVALVAVCPAGRYGTGLRIRTPTFFTTSAVENVRPGETAVLLPTDDDPNVAAATMMWQLRAGLRFRLVGGYAMFSHGGHQSYQPTVPALVTLVHAVERSGRAPAPAQLDEAADGLAAIDVVVITDAQPNRDLVEQALAELTGCAIRRVSDVDLCRIDR